MKELTFDRVIDVLFMFVDRHSNAVKIRLIAVYMKRHIAILLLLSVTGLYCCPSLSAFGATPSAHCEASIPAMPGKDVHFRFTNLSYAKVQQPAESDLNPDNYLNICRYKLNSSFRPDFRAAFSKLRVSFKPRLELSDEYRDKGSDKGRSKTDAELFVHEYAVRLSASENILLSYGREDLQWGPAFLLSPSNPFFSYNGRNQPEIEVRGADYGRLIWSPDLNWSASFIVNTGKGRKKLLTDFEKTYAAKLDYLTDKAYFSLILSDREHTGSKRLGGFFSWNINDAVIFYGEGSASDGEVEMLFGGSYTLLGGGTVSGEYFYNGGGVNHGSLIKKIMTLTEKEARESLFRKHYVLLQYYDSDLLSRWSILIRDTINLDDQSFSLLIHGQYNLGDHSQVFATATINHGDRHSEFAAIIDSSFMFGLEFTY